MKRNTKLRICLALDCAFVGVLIHNHKYDWAAAWALSSIGYQIMFAIQTVNLFIAGLVEAAK